MITDTWTALLVYTPLIQLLTIDVSSYLWDLPRVRILKQPIIDSFIEV